MADRRSPAGPFFATDQVLEGATLRDRFLTAFVLRNAGFVSLGRIEQQEPACVSGFSGPDELGMNVLSFSIGNTAENGPEPLRVATIEEWFLVDDEDDM